MTLKPHFFNSLRDHVPQSVRRDYYLKVPDECVIEVPQVSLDVCVEIVQCLALHCPQILVVKAHAPLLFPHTLTAFSVSCKKRELIHKARL